MNDIIKQPESFVQALNRLEDGTATQDDVLTVLFFSDNLARAVKVTRDRIDEEATKWIKANGPVIVKMEGSTLKWYVGSVKKTKAIDRGRVFLALMDLAQGDIAKAAEFLSSDPFKHGAIRKAIEQDQERGRQPDEPPTPKFDELFEVIIEDELNKPKLQKIDTKFLK